MCSYPNILDLLNIEDISSEGTYEVWWQATVDKIKIQVLIKSDKPLQGYYFERSKGGNGRQVTKKSP